MNRVAFLRRASLLLLIPGALSAQEAGAFAVTRGADPVALEQFNRVPGELSASLTRLSGAATRERVHYKATLLPDASAPLLEVSVWRADDPEVRIGTVEFRFNVDSDGRILGGAVPSQGLRITRAAGR